MSLERSWKYISNDILHIQFVFELQLQNENENEKSIVV